MLNVVMLSVEAPPFRLSLQNMNGWKKSSPRLDIHKSSYDYLKIKIILKLSYIQKSSLRLISFVIRLAESTNGRKKFVRNVVNILNRLLQNIRRKTTTFLQIAMFQRG